MQFSLALMKQKKLEEKQLIIALCKEHTMRKRPMYDWSFNSKIAIIAEVKKASPSKGIIKIVDPAEQAVHYQQAGAKAISVLTDSHYFGGSFDDLCHVANVVTLPVLCKEFICYPEQIDAAYLCGADSVLLINAMLTASELQMLYDYAIAKHLTPLIEIHALSELDTVLTLKPQYIMVNMRNLNTLEIDYKTGTEALQAILSPIIKICASSIDTSHLLRHIKEKTGATIFLVGTALMQAENPKSFLQELSNVC